MPRTLIRLELELLGAQWGPDFTVALDNEIICSGRHHEPLITHAIDRDLGIGEHRLSIQCRDLDRTSIDHDEIGVKVQSVRFQHIDHDFRIYSRYQPDYPAAWYSEQVALGQTPLPEIYSSCLTWNGIWYLDFQLPIYVWMHRKINLGWLI